MNRATFTVEVTDENKELIMMISGLLTGKATYTKHEKPEGPSAAKEQEKELAEELAEDSTTLENVTEVAKAIMEEHGEQFVRDVMMDLKIKPLVNLGKSMAKIPKEKYDEIIKAWMAGPQKEKANDEGWDTNPAEEVSVDTVKKALNAYAKANSRDDARVIMAKFGVEVLKEVETLAKDKLAELLKAVL